MLKELQKVITYRPKKEVKRERISMSEANLQQKRLSFKEISIVIYTITNQGNQLITSNCKMLKSDSAP